MKTNDESSIEEFFKKYYNQYIKDWYMILDITWYPIDRYDQGGEKSLIFM